MVRILIAGTATVGVLLGTHAAAQQPGGGATLYNRGHFSGVHRTINGPAQFAEPFVMRSVTLPAGSQWEFCSGETFSGCKELSQSKPAMIMNVRSARPVAKILTAGPGAPIPGQPFHGQSLHGLASEYFVAPDDSGVRVEVNLSTSESSARRATEFCRAHGWRESAHQRLQSAGGKYYLADVLCDDGP